MFGKTRHLKGFLCKHWLGTARRSTTHTTAPLRSSVSRQRWWWEVVRSLHLLRNAQAANRRPNRCTYGSSIRLSQIQWWRWNGWTSNCYKRLYQYLTISDGPEREQENKIAWQLWYFFVFPEKLPLPAQWCVYCPYSASYSCLSIGSTYLGIVFFFTVGAVSKSNLGPWHVEITTFW